MTREFWRRAGEEAAGWLDLPPELAFDTPHLELMGQRRLLMGQHKGVLSYSTERVEISGGGLVVVVTGRELQLMAMTEEDLRLDGWIERVELVSRCTEE